MRRVAVAERDACAEAANVVRRALRDGPIGWHFGCGALGAAADAARLSVSVGSTPTSCLPPRDGLGPAVTEIHPGNYVFFDAAQVGVAELVVCMQVEVLTFRVTTLKPTLNHGHSHKVALGSCDPNDVAVRVLTRVVGHSPNTNALQVDMGWAAQGGGQGEAEHYGAFTHTVWVPPNTPKAHLLVPGGDPGGDPGSDPGGDAAAGLRVRGLTQEIGEVSTADGSPLNFGAFPVGAVLAFAPHRSGAAGHCHRALLVLEDGVVVRELEVAKGW